MSHTNVNNLKIVNVQKYIKNLNVNIICFELHYLFLNANFKLETNYSVTGQLNKAVNKGGWE